MKMEESYTSNFWSPMQMQKKGLNSQKIHCVSKSIIDGYVLIKLHLRVYLHMKKMHFNNKQKKAPQNFHN